MNDLIEQFVLFLRGSGFSEHTIKAYTRDLLEFASFCCVNKVTSPSQVTKLLIYEYIGNLSKRKLKSITIERKIYAVSSFMQFLVKRDIIKSSPVKKIKLPPKKKGLPFFIREKEINASIDFLKKKDCFLVYRDYLVLLILYSTGVRASELIKLKWKDVDISREVIRIIGKGSKVREIPLIPELISAIKKYKELLTKKFPNIKPEGSTPLIINDKGNPISYIWLYRKIKKLTANTLIPKNSPHVLRHTFATHLINNGMDIKMIKELLGHKSLATTQKYTHLSIQALKKVYSYAHPRAK